MGILLSSVPFASLGPVIVLQECAVAVRLPLVFGVEGSGAGMGKWGNGAAGVGEHCNLVHWHWTYAYVHVNTQPHALQAPSA